MLEQRTPLCPQIRQVMYLSINPASHLREARYNRGVRTMSDNYSDGKYVYCRFRRKRNSDELLDAHDYGYKAWRIPIK